MGSDDSVSPEPLSEAAMRPPPVPPPPGKSPMTLKPTSKGDANHPATPATLMRFPSKQNVSKTNLSSSAQPLDDVMEDIMLPDAAALPGRSPLPELDTSLAADEDEATPGQSAKSAKVSADSTPRGALPKNTSSESFSKPGKSDARGARGSKKRQSTSSAAISPALRPKISPSISPLVPASGK
jgi:hypothetical protein